jgi:hypothetical protein
VFLKKCAYIKNYIPTRNNGIGRVSIIESGQPKVVKPKMRGRELRIGVYWQGALKQKGIKKGATCNLFLCCNI